MTPDQGVSPRRIARNTVYQVVGEVIGRLAMLVFWTLMAHELGREGFGEFTVALSIVVFIYIASLGTDFVITRDLAQDRTRLAQLFWNTTALKGVAGTVGAVAVFVVALLGSYGTEAVHVITILAAATLIDLLGTTIQSVFRGLEDMGPIAISKLVQRLVTTAAGSVAMLLGAGVVLVALIYLGGVILSVMYLLLLLWRRVGVPRPVLSTVHARKLLTASLPLAVGFIFGAALARIDTVILSLMKPSADVGLYGGAYRLYESSLFVNAIFAFTVYPALSRLGKDTTPTLGRALETACKVSALTLFPVGATFVVFAQPIVNALYGSAFAPAADALRYLGFAAALWGFFGLSTVALASQSRQDLVGYVIGGGLALNIALNLALIPAHSFRGAAAAMALTVTAIDLLMILVLRNITGRVSFKRIAAGPVTGCVPLVVAYLLLGPHLIGIPVGLAAWMVTTYLAERWMWPDDVAAFWTLLRRPVASGLA